MNKLTKADISVSDKNFRMAMYSKLRDYESSELTPKQVIALRDALAELHGMTDFQNPKLDMKKFIKNASALMSASKIAFKAKSEAAEPSLAQESSTYGNTEQQMEEEK